VDRAYLQKYNTAGALKYAKDLGSSKSRGTTVELVPLSSTRLSVDRWKDRNFPFAELIGIWKAGMAVRLRDDSSRNRTM
jgi:hypothetical protein